MRYEHKIWDNPISIMIDKMQLDLLISELPNYAKGKWKHIYRLVFEYHGQYRVQVSIPYNEDSWRNGYLEFGNSNTVKVLDQDFITAQERDNIIEQFIKDVLEPYQEDHQDIKILYGTR